MRCSTRATPLRLRELVLLLIAAEEKPAHGFVLGRASALLSATEASSVRASAESRCTRTAQYG
jgi:hypothetical protein